MRTIASAADWAEADALLIADLRVTDVLVRPADGPAWLVRRIDGRVEERPALVVPRLLSTSSMIERAMRRAPAERFDPVVLDGGDDPAQLAEIDELALDLVRETKAAASASEAQWESEQSLLEILEASPVGVTIIDQAGQVMFWNSRLLEMLGQGETFGEAAGRGFFRDDAVRDQLLGQVRNGQRIRDAEVAVMCGDGSTAWALVTMEQLEFEGRPAALTWYYDITERKLAEQDLRASQDALLAVLDASPVGASIFDPSGRVLFWNNRLIDILGVQGEAFAEMASLSFDGSGEPRRRLLTELRRTGRVRDVATSWTRPDGTPMTTLVSMENVVFEREQGVLTWLYDVTDLHRAQAAAEAATAAKSSFLATMSHEIRTPMNGVVTMAELLSETKLSPEQASMARTIRDSGTALLTIINDILDFSKIEAGKLEIEQVPMEVRDAVGGVATLLAPKADEKGIGFACRVAPGVPAWICGDPTRLRQILLNLAGNAIKFTEAGRVDVRCSAVGDGLRFEIADTGIGLTAEQTGALFRPFSQADASTSRKFGGSGLGLSICKALVELMHGRLGVESVAGQGSTFWFELPAPAVEAPAPDGRLAVSTTLALRWTPPDAAVAERKGGLILCAEDNVTNRKVLDKVLSRLGFAHDLVEDGAQAFAALQVKRYGLLLTDCHMPEMDGYELAQAVRAAEADGRLSGRLPIVALTADALKGTAERCLAAGMDAYLTKPLSLDAVDRTVGELLPVAAILRRPPPAADERNEGGALAPPDPAILDPAMLKELVGDDRQQMVDILAEFGGAAGPMVEAALASFEQDPLEARLQAHSLKSAARYVGAARLADLAGAIEEAIARDDLDDARAALAHLDGAYRVVVGAIEALQFEQQIVQMRTEIAQIVESDADGIGDSGTELHAVVTITEHAANTILEAAETIAGKVGSVGDAVDAQLIQDQLTQIFEACSFQDLTSQRVRRAMAQLSTIEGRLQQFVQRLDQTESELARSPRTGPIRQADIDRLMVESN